MEIYTKVVRGGNVYASAFHPMSEVVDSPPLSLHLPFLSRTPSSQYLTIFNLETCEPPIYFEYGPVVHITKNNLSRFLSLWL